MNPISLPCPLEIFCTLSIKSYNSPNITVLVAFFAQKISLEAYVKEIRTRVAEDSRIESKFLNSSFWRQLLRKRLLALIYLAELKGLQDYWNTGILSSLITIIEKRKLRGYWKLLNATSRTKRSAFLEQPSKKTLMTLIDSPFRCVTFSLTKELNCFSLSLKPNSKT